MEDLPAWVRYVSALGPAFIFLGAAVGSLVAWLNLRHRRTQDRKDEWWRRTQWALEQALKDEPPAQEVGLDVLALQARSPLGDEEDALIIDTVADDILGRLASANLPQDDADIHYRVETEATAEDEDDERSPA